MEGQGGAGCTVWHETALTSHQGGNFSLLDITIFCNRYKINKFKFSCRIF